jgi:hypothetical protein
MPPEFLSVSNDYVFVEDWMKQTLELIANYGLPLILTVWFVFRIDITITKLVNLLEAFIKRQIDKEEESKERAKELKGRLDTLSEQCVGVINQIKILEVRLDK